MQRYLYAIVPQFLAALQQIGYCAYAVYGFAMSRTRLSGWRAMLTTPASPIRR
jgi:hypothetical protein